jgi:hypothetical protein
MNRSETFLFLIYMVDIISATLGATLAGHRSKPRVYIGCMKSGPVLSQWSVADELNEMI